jgi:hypothetical protein
MRLTHAILAIFDISGYTAFIRHRTVTLLHAEQIVTDLLESVVERAEHPLLLNKFEGDAALLWTAVDADPASVARSVLMQARQAFEAFSGRLDLIRGERSHCSCAACANIASLQLKVLLHSGEIAIKQVRQFEELAGEPVIALHRLLKNQVPSRCYVLCTDAFRALTSHTLPAGAAFTEKVDGLEPIAASWFPADTQHLAQLPTFD